MKFRLLSLVLLVVLYGCKKDVSPEEYNSKAADPKLFHETTTHLTDVIIHDIFQAAGCQQDLWLFVPGCL
jgi:hypothetical protein